MVIFLTMDIMREKFRSVIVDQNHYLNKIFDVHHLCEQSLVLKLLSPARKPDIFTQNIIWVLDIYIYIYRYIFVNESI